MVQKSILTEKQMLDLHLDIQPHTAQKLKKIFEFHPDSEVFAQNLIAYQVAELKRGILNLQLDLQKYEETYQMSSANFYEQFTEGNLDDREEFIMWAGLYEMLLENEKRLQELT